MRSRTDHGLGDSSRGISAALTRFARSRFEPSDWMKRVRGSTQVISECQDLLLIHRRNL